MHTEHRLSDPLPVGTYRTDSRRCMACSSQKSQASFETYSGPLSDCQAPVGGQPMDDMNACQTLYAASSVGVVRSVQKTTILKREKSSTNATT